MEAKTHKKKKKQRLWRNVLSSWPWREEQPAMDLAADSAARNAALNAMQHGQGAHSPQLFAAKPDLGFGFLIFGNHFFSSPNR